MLGARRSLLTLVKEIAGTRYEPLVLVPSRGALTDQLERRRLRYRVLKLPPWRKGTAWLQMLPRLHALRRLCREEKIGLIHCNEIYPNPHAVVATARGGLVGESLGALLSCRRFSSPTLPIVTHMRLSVTERMVRNYLLAEASRIVAVSHGAAHDFDPFPWKESKVRVVYNGVDFEEFELALARRKFIRASLGYQESDFVIGQVGLLMPRKRPWFLIEAAPRLRERIPNLRILFVGETSPGHEGYLGELEHLARDRGVSDIIRFLPFQDWIADVFAALDLHVLLSNDEGFGRVVVEAAAVRIPTVASNVGGIPELIRHGETGYLLGGDRAADDNAFRACLDQFVAAVEELARNTELRARMGAAAYEYAKRQFSPEVYAHQMMRVFDEAIEEFEASLPPW